MTKTVADLEVLFSDEGSAKKAIRSDEVAALLKGMFGPGRTPYLQTVKFPSGSELRLKFVNVVKEILNSKGKPVPGKESFLSYLEVTVLPAGKKGFYFTTDVTQVVWAPSKSKAEVKHAVAIAALTEFATSLGIDLSAPGAWHTVYSQSY
jgi:hypothetical protein